MKNQFNKILLWNEITNQIAYFTVQQGYEKLFDFLDMNCGAIPEGPYEQIVDPDCPEQFLQMYTQIVHKRFAYAVVSLLNMNEEYIRVLEDFMYRTGKEMEIPKINSVEEGEKIFKSFYLDGVNENVWIQAGRNISVYEQLIESFKKGLFGLEK